MKGRSGAVAHADHASAPLLFDPLRIEQCRPRHPAGLGRGAWGLAARPLEPLAEMREPGGGILLDPVRQKQRHTAWSQYLKSSHHGPCRSRYVAWHQRLGGLPWARHARGTTRTLPTVKQTREAMLKITIHDAAGPLRIELEGRLAGRRATSWNTAGTRPRRAIRTGHSR
jgi:hypothetical protein